MKNRRVILWLMLALALVVGAHVFLSYKGGVTAALVQRTTLISPSLALATRLSVARAHEPPVVLEHEARWRIVAPYHAAADERAVLRLLDLLSSENVSDTSSDHELARLARDRADYGLGEADALRVTVANDAESATLLLGAATPTGDGVYAAVEGEDAVYIVSPAVYETANLPPEGFRQRALLPAWAGAAVALDVKHGPGSFMRFVREGDAWRMREPTSCTANAAKIRKLLGDVAAAEARDFVWPVGAKGEGLIPTASLLAGYGLDPDSAVTLTLKCADGVERQVAFGKAAKDGRVYALVQNAQAIVTVDGALKDQALAGAAAFTESRLFAVERAAVSRLALTEDAVDYLLAKGDDGQWRLDAPVAAPADPEGVNALLDRLLALRTADVVEEGVAVSVNTSVAPVTVSRTAALDDIRLDALRSRDILKVDPAQVRRVVVTPRGGKPTAVVYDRDRRGWNVEQSARAGAVDAEALSALLAAFNPLVAVRIVRLKVSAADLRGYGLEAPRLTVAIDQEREDAVRRNLLVGDPVEGGAYATLGATDAVFVLDEATVRRLSAPLVRER